MRIILYFFLFNLSVNLFCVTPSDSTFFEEDGPDGKDQIDAPQLFDGTTERNYPDYGFKYFDIKQCRKEVPKCPSFLRVYKGNWKNPKDPLNIDFRKMTYNDKIYLYEIIIDTKDPKYFIPLIRIIFSDTIKENLEIRKNLIKCLGEYNMEPSKKLLRLLVNNKNEEIATIAAINLIRFGDFELSLNFFENRYKNNYYVDIVYSSLMYVNNENSIQILKLLEQKQESLAYRIDALAALSLIGNCDYVFNKLKNISNIEQETVLIKVVSCLAYYIGTPEAFKFIENMKVDNGNVTNEINHVLYIYQQTNN